MRTTFVSKSLLTLLLLGACNIDGVTAPSGEVFRPPLGAALPDSQPGQWQWFDFPNPRIGTASSRCNDGSSTGIGINRSGTKSNLLLFLNGGGACWDYLTCYRLGTAATGPYGEAQFRAMTNSVSGSIFDRTVPLNPFKDWNMVFIPYCTGDVHAGDNQATYTADGQPARAPWNHRGRANMVAFLSSLAATFPTPAKLVVSGSSAGGFGASFNYDLARRYWPSGQMYLIDDSGPVFIGDSIPANLRASWFSSWRIEQVLDPLCTTCRNDFSSFLPIIASKYPRDRAALLSFTRDRVIRSFFLQTEDAFQSSLYDLSDRVLDTLPTYRYYYLTGETHTLLPIANAVTSDDGVKLFDWLTQMVTDAPGWSSHRP